LLLNLCIMLAMTFSFASCSTDGSHLSDESSSGLTLNERGNEIYAELLDLLENTGDTIDYQTLMHVHHAIGSSQGNIPDIDHLIRLLINKRNDDPRIDQMILIFAALVIENSKYPVPDVYELFRLLLEKDESRLTEWVICFVASAIGRYPFDIPEGDRLADLLEKRLNSIESETKKTKEYFGFHFLPPPKSDFIRSYLVGIKEQRTRETERIFYYSLISNNLPETQIETILRKIQLDGDPDTGKPCLLPMKYIFNNIDKLKVNINSDNKIVGPD
jgi:hypothetical protein